MSQNSLDGMRIVRPGGGRTDESRRSAIRELISPSETGGRWGLVEVSADPDEAVATHIHVGEPEAFIVLEGDMELHGAEGVTKIGPGDIVFVPPDTEHGIRAPEGGRWFAIWPPALDGLLSATASVAGDPAALKELRRLHGIDSGKRYR
jgi:quercetin dioxygenase-like cupin family protein